MRAFSGAKSRQILSFFAATLGMTFGSILQAQVTANVFTRVLLVRVGTATGTGFSLDVDGRQYLITAKHIVGMLKPEDTIDVFVAEKWSPLKVKVLRCSDPIDIAVLVPPTQLTPSFPLEMGNHRIGQDAYFVGFPYGLSISPKSMNNMNGVYPFPFLKKSIISAQDTSDGIITVFLDGHNNPGFSGGPIVFRDLDQSQLIFNILGVVSGFRPEFIPTVTREAVKPGEDTSKEEEWRIQKMPDGRVFRLKDTSQMTPLNTGIIVGYHIRHAVDLIHKNPIGPKIAK